MENKFNQFIIKHLQNKEYDITKEELQELLILYFKSQHKECSLKEGDTVKIVREWVSGENGTTTSFNNNIKAFIGKTTTIISKTPTSYFLDCDYYFPYFVLEKVEEKYIPLDYNDDLVGKVIKHKDSEVKRMVVTQNIEGVFMGTSNWTVFYQNLKDNYTFADGTACHKLKQ